MKKVARSPKQESNESSSFTITAPSQPYRRTAAAWRGRSVFGRVPQICKHARQVTPGMDKAEDFHRIGLRIINQHITKAGHGPDPIRRREVWSHTAQEWVPPEPSRSVCDGTLQLLRRDRVFHGA